jgi:hypothetical protein
MRDKAAIPFLFLVRFTFVVRGAQCIYGTYLGEFMFHDADTIQRVHELRRVDWDDLVVMNSCAPTI